MSLVKSSPEWERILRESGCLMEVAERWAPVFAVTIKEGTFSAGERELPDFLSTILHESQMLEKMRENGNYSAARIREIGMASKPGTRWRSLVPRALELAYNPPKFFEACYAGRMGNGPEGSGDGRTYPGRGPLGLTGKENYAWVGDLVGQDLVHIPELAAQPHFGLEIAIGWWEGRVPDHCLGDERKVRKVVNGGYFGIEDVEKLCKRVQKAL
jgi:putative chitinase